jgi:NTP pyrophosphatase (non-canonical NTP hydrolase)
MNFNDYQSKAVTTARFDDSVAIPYLTLGLSNEAGEVAGKVKKFLRGDEKYVDEFGVPTPEFYNAIDGELGDVLWYLAVLCDYLGLSLEEVAEHNISKLFSRAERGVIKGDGDER